MLCGAQGSWGAVGAASVGAPTLVGWRGCVCVRGWAYGDVRQAEAVSLCLLEGLPQAPDDIQVVLGRGEVAGVDSQGVERIGQHGFPCGLQHPPPRRPEAAVLHRPLAGPMDQALEGGLSPGPLSQVPELRVGPALPPLSLGGAAVLGGGVGVDGRDRVFGTGRGGGPGGFLVVLFRGGARGVGARADVDPRLCARVGTIRYVYRSVSIPYSTPVSCMVSPSPNKDPVGTTKCPLIPWFYDIFELIPTTKILSQKKKRKFQQIFVTTDLLSNVSQNTLQMIHTLNCLLPFYALPCLQFSQKDNVS